MKRRRVLDRLFRSYPMRLLARISIFLLLMGAGTGLLALQRGGYQSDDEFGSARQRAEQDLNGEARSEYSWSRLRYTAANSYGGYGGGGRRSCLAPGYFMTGAPYPCSFPSLTRLFGPPTPQNSGADN